MRLILRHVLRRGLLFVAVAIATTGCDLVLYDPDVVEGARRSEQLTEVASNVVTGWTYQDGNGRVITPIGWYPDALESTSGYIIATAPERPELTVARVENGTVRTRTTITLAGSQTSDRWEVWPVPIDATLQDQYVAANPEASSRAPVLIVARFVEDGLRGTEVRISGIGIASDGTGLTVRDDLATDLEGAIQSQVGAAQPPQLVSVQLAGFGPGATLANVEVTDSAGVVLQVLARNRDTGQTAPFVFVADGLEVADWVEAGSASVPAASRAGSSFVSPDDSEGNRPGLVRHATLVDGGPGTVLSFRDGAYDGAPWRSFTILPAGSINELSSGFGISSVTVEGLVRTARSGAIGELSILELPEVSLRTEPWGSVWYSGTYPTEPGAPGSPEVFTQHAAADLFTHVGIAHTITGDYVLQVTSYRD